MGNDHGTNKPEDTNDAEEQRRKDVIKKEEKSSNKRFFSRYSCGVAKKFVYLPV